MLTLSSRWSGRARAEARRTLLGRIGREVEEAEEIVSHKRGHSRVPNQGRVLLQTSGHADGPDLVGRSQVSQMEIEVQTSSAQDKPKLQAKLRQHKSTTQKHKSELVRHYLTPVKLGLTGANPPLCCCRTAPPRHSTGRPRRHRRPRRAPRLVPRARRRPAPPIYRHGRPKLLSRSAAADQAHARHGPALGRPAPA